MKRFTFFPILCKYKLYVNITINITNLKQELHVSRTLIFIVSQYGAIFLPMTVWLKPNYNIKSAHDEIIPFECFSLHPLVFDEPVTSDCRRVAFCVAGGFFTWEEWISLKTGQIYQHTGRRWITVVLETVMKADLSKAPFQYSCSLMDKVYFSFRSFVFPFCVCLQPEWCQTIIKIVYTSV